MIFNECAFGLNEDEIERITMVEGSRQLIDEKFNYIIVIDEKEFILK